MLAVNAQAWIDRARTLATHPRLPEVASVVLVVVLGWQLAGLTWALLPAAPAAAPPPGPAAGRSVDRPATSGSRTDPAARLAKLHLFGAADSGPEGAAAKARLAAANAPETRLDLTLKGVYAPGGGDGLAIISAGGGPEEVYAVGDTIAGDAEVSGVFADRVVLRRAGGPEVLRLEGAGEQASAGATGADVAADPRRIAERARELRRRLLDNPFALARLVRFQPYRDDGELIGFRVQPRAADTAMLAELGIRPSDVITRVNGIELDAFDKGGQALQALRDARTVDVTLLRNGRRRQLSIPIGEAG